MGRIYAFGGARYAALVQAVGKTGRNRRSIEGMKMVKNMVSVRFKFPEDKNLFDQDALGYPESKGIQYVKVFNRNEQIVSKFETLDESKLIFIETWSRNEFRFKNDEGEYLSFFYDTTKEVMIGTDRDGNRAVAVILK